VSAAFHPAVLAATWPETPLLQGLRLEVAPAVAASYRRPGQFVQVRLPGQRDGSYFAIANGPHREGIELLVKRGEGLPDELIALPPGAAVETTEAMGAGYPLADHEGRDVLLFATGSGIAPIRAALHEILDRRDRWGEVSLFFGVRSPDALPYAGELEEAERRGVRVHRVISGVPARAGHARWVQERFRTELPPVGNAVALLCGLQGMIEGVREALAEAGLPDERIFLNV